MSSTILVPVNGDWPDEKAVELACDFAKISKGKVIVLYVIEMSRNLPVDAEVNEATARGEEILKTIEELTHDQPCEIEAELLQARQVGPAVVQEAAEREAVEALGANPGGFNRLPPNPVWKTPPTSLVTKRGRPQERAPNKVA